MRWRCECKRTQRPTFGLPGDIRPTWCSKCPTKPKAAVDVKNKKCECPKKVQPIFGLSGDIRPTWCSKCPTKPKDAVDVMNKKCECKKALPAFGLPGDIRPTWCSKCPTKPKDAVDVKNRKCECKKALPTFGLPGDVHRTWCIQCPTKPKDAVNVISKKCECKKAVPIFGLPGDVRATWCKQCPTKPKDAVDVINKKCECDKEARPTFGLSGDVRPSWCSQCPTKPKDAVNVISKKCECKKAVPIFGLPGDVRATWCSQCPTKPKDAVDVKSKKCLSNWCQTQVSNIKYRGYCWYCFTNLFPDEPVTRNFKTKERLAMNDINAMLSTEFPSYTPTYDRQVDGGCSKKRPDIFVDCYTHVIIGEIDEKGHNTDTYCVCESKRLMMLMQDFGMRPIIVIRLNPDAFVDHKHKKYRGCFEMDMKTGLLGLSDKKQWRFRMDVYLDRFRYHLQTVPSMEMTVDHLFYNGFNP